MKINRIGIVVFLCIIVLLSSCSNASNDPVEVSKPQVEQSDESIELRKETEHFEFYCFESDVECLEDLAEALEENYLRITTDLNADLDFKVKVHVYKGIDAFHKAIGRTDAPNWVVGAYYGEGIKMVSPLNPGRSHDYYSLMKTVVHEFTHVVINNIVSPEVMVPMWVHEGVASYEAGQTDILYGIDEYVKRDKVPSIGDLEAFNSFGMMMDNKVYEFSYTLVEYIIDEYGIEELNEIIRSPSDYTGVFGIDKDEFELAWKDYLKDKYVD